MKRPLVAFELFALSVAIVIAATPAPALASGFQLIEQNGSGLGNAYAGQAAGVSDASAIFFNPAALTEVTGKQCVASVSPIGLSTAFTDTGSVRPFLPTRSPIVIPVPLGGSGGDAGAWIPVPNGYFSWQAGSRVWLGLGVNVPFGLKTEWDPDWVGRFHAVKSDVKTINFNPTLAVKVTEDLSLGAGVSYQRLQAELSQSVAYGGISVGAAAPFGTAATAGILAQLGPAGMAREGLVSMKGHDWSWGWNAGMHLRLAERLHLGASYRSRVKHVITGDVAFGDAPVFATSGPLAALGTGLNANFSGGPVEARIQLPDTFSAGAAYYRGRVELLADWTWTGWSSIQDLTIFRSGGSQLSNVPLKFKDTWRIGAGFNYLANDKLKLRAGTAYDKTPVQDAYRTPRLPDQDRVWAAAGFQYVLGGKSVLDVGYAHLFIKEGTSDLANQDAQTAPPTGTLVGTYPGNVNLFTVQYRISF